MMTHEPARGRIFVMVPIDAVDGVRARVETARVSTP
jgi:hypothetical protein